MIIPAIPSNPSSNPSRETHQTIYDSGRHRHVQMTQFHEMRGFIGTPVWRHRGGSSQIIHSNGIFLVNHPAMAYPHDDGNSHIRVIKNHSSYDKPDKTGKEMRCKRHLRDPQAGSTLKFFGTPPNSLLYASGAGGFTCSSSWFHT